MEQLRFAAIQRFDDTIDVLRNVLISQGLVMMQLREFIKVEGTICNVFYHGRDDPVPVKEITLPELQGLHKGGLGPT